MRKVDDGKKEKKKKKRKEKRRKENNNKPHRAAFARKCRGSCLHPGKLIEEDQLGAEINEYFPNSSWFRRISQEEV